MSGPEFSTNTDLEARLNGLFKNAPPLEVEIHTEPIFFDVKTARLLQPELPDLLYNDLAWDALTQKPTLGTSIKSNLLRKIMARVLDGTPTSRVTFSDTFTVKSSERYGAPKDGDPFSRLRVKRTSYDGSLAFNDKSYTFLPEQPVFTVSSNWLNEDGRDIYPQGGVAYTYTPHTDSFIKHSNPNIAFAPPYTNPDSSDLDNFLAIIEAAERIPDNLS